MKEPGAFEWDDAKAKSNVVKHDVRLDAAIEVFRDSNGVEYDVSRKADVEVRLKRIGIVGGRLLAVVYTLRGDVARIISARRTNRSEEARYGYRPVRGRP